MYFCKCEESTKLEEKRFRNHSIRIGLMRALAASDKGSYFEQEKLLALEKKMFDILQASLSWRFRRSKR